MIMMRLVLPDTTYSESINLCIFNTFLSSLSTIDHSKGNPSILVNELPSESNASQTKHSGESSKYNCVVVCFIDILVILSTITSHRITLSVDISFAIIIP
jgi:hypothetical protein